MVLAHCKGARTTELLGGMVSVPSTSDSPQNESVLIPSMQTWSERHLLFRAKV